MKQKIFDNLKNIIGWKTRQKVLAFAVDDYGNVRLHSRQARENIANANPQRTNRRFDLYDSLETTEDLHALYETLSSVKDREGHAAIFTPYALPCNIDFEKINTNPGAGYQYESLSSTFEKLSVDQPAVYAGAWALWQEGVDSGLLAPEFHGREHLNLKLFSEKLRDRDQELMVALANRSNIGLTNTRYPTIRSTAAFSFWSADELNTMPTILETGLAAFEEVFGYRAIAFTPPAQEFHSSLEPVLWANGIRAIDKPFFTKRHLGEGASRREFNVTGFNRKDQVSTLVRNVVFEPTHDQGIDWVNLALQQIATAFRWNRPALVSSHRVNFCGHIDPQNREIGLTGLRELLRQVVRRWPDIRFVSVRELVKMIEKDHGVSHH